MAQPQAETSKNPITPNTVVLNTDSNDIVVSTAALEMNVENINKEENSNQNQTNVQQQQPPVLVPPTIANATNNIENQNVLSITNITTTTSVPPPLPPPQQIQNNTTNTITNVSVNNSIVNKKRSREDFDHENKNINNPPQNQTQPQTNVISPPPLKKMKLSTSNNGSNNNNPPNINDPNNIPNNNNTNNHVQNETKLNINTNSNIDTNTNTTTIVNPEQSNVTSNPYMNYNQNNSDAFDETPLLSTQGKVLSRTSSELKRYLNGMDEDTLRQDILSKLCEKHQSLFESIRYKMNTNTILCKIFIRSLSYDTKDKTVHEMFNQYGNVKEAVIVKDRQTGKSRGFGFITMTNASEAQLALTQHRKMIDGREAICNLASKPQGQKTSTNNNTSNRSKSRKDDSSHHGHSSHHGGHNLHHSHHRGHNDRSNDLYSRSHRNNIANINPNDRYSRNVPPPPATNPYAVHAVSHYAPTPYPYAADYTAYQYPTAAAINPYGATPQFNPYAAAHATTAHAANPNAVATTAQTANNPNGVQYQQNITAPNANVSAFGVPYRYN